MKIKKINNFREIIKKNRSFLVEKGFNKHTVNSWAYTGRVPSYDTACKLSAVLGIVLTEIPYYKMERG